MLRIKEANAAVATMATPQAGARIDSAGSGAMRLSRRAQVRRDSIRAAARRDSAGVHTADRFVPAGERVMNDSVARVVAESIRAITPEENQLRKARTAEAKLRLEIAQRARNRYDIEIHKKFSLAAACIIFVLVGAPIAVRFPRGGVGLVIGVSLLVFALYYVGLIGGESLANEGIVPPFWAMWGTNVILAIVGIVLLLRMGKDFTSNRGGDWSDRLDAVLARFGRGPQARIGRTA
jgi:hypothetical protein